MVDTLDGRTIGYMALAFINWELRTGEADAIVRGLPAPKGLMMLALKSLLAWGQSQLGLTHFQVRVRSDNSAIEFYRKIGFVEFSRVRLRSTVDGDSRVWHETPTATTTEGPELVYMRLEETGS
jgi:RimJ/RimL family protein N-acetyltransferase